MLRRVLLAASAVAACALPSSAQAAPPYCATVSDGGGTLVESCLASTNCLAYGAVLPSSPAGFVYCVTWP